MSDMPDNIWAASIPNGESKQNGYWNERQDHTPYVRKDLVPQWISVDERLPEEDGRYLVADGSSWNEIVYFDVDRGWDEYASIVTRWMPIPEPPS
jgi:hypothetical protein